MTPALARASECVVYLVGEGPGDIGDLATGGVSDQASEGFMQPLLRNLAGEKLRLRFIGSRTTRLVTGRRRAIAERSTGLAKKASDALRLAEDAGARAVVFVADVDREGGSKKTTGERRRRREKIAGDIRRGFEQAKRTTPALGAIVTIAATPVRMIEAWALGDPAALRAIGGGTFAEEHLANSPEALWGAKRDPESNHPKRVIQRVLGREPSRDDLAAIADSADLVLLRTSCPESFEPFAQEVAAAVLECTQALIDV